MKLTVYHLKNCDTCKKAIRQLQDAGHDLHLVDVRADGVPVASLRKISTSAGWQPLLNTRSTTWRGLDASEKSGVDETKALELMIKHPTLIKRPVIVSNEIVTIGWSEEPQAAWL